MSCILVHFVKQVNIIYVHEEINTYSSINSWCNVYLLSFHCPRTRSHILYKWYNLFIILVIFLCPRYCVGHVTMLVMLLRYQPSRSGGVTSNCIYLLIIIMCYKNLHCLQCIIPNELEKTHSRNFIENKGLI